MADCDLHRLKTKIDIDLHQSRCQRRGEIGSVTGRVIRLSSNELEQPEQIFLAGDRGRILVLRQEFDDLVAGGGNQNHVMRRATCAVMQREPNLLGALDQHLRAAAAFGSDERARSAAPSTNCICHSPRRQCSAMLSSARDNSAEPPDRIGRSWVKRKHASGTRNHPKTPANIALCPFLAKRGLPSGQRLGCTGCETAGLPLGLCAVKFWTRDKFKGTAALKRKINPTRVPIEKKESIRWLENLKQSTELLDDPGRCIHIGDRESDIYELFCTAQEVGTHFLVRTCVDRLAGDGDHTVADEMDVTSVKGLHRIEVRDGKGDLEEAILEIRYRRIRILPPVGKRKRYPALTLTVIHAQEQKTPKNRKKIDWKLLTDLPVQSRKDAIEKLEWYAMR